MSVEIKKTEAVSLLDHFGGRQEQMLAFARALVETESPSGDEAGSRAVVSLIAEAAHGIDGVTSIERLKGEHYGEHLLVRAFTDGPQKGAVLIVGHTDTVHPKGTLAERPWRQDGGRIYGPGIFDMKANCALALEALRACGSLKLLPRRPVTLLLTCDEEDGSPTGRALVETEAQGARCALVLEPPASGGRVKTARKGTGIFKMRAEGRAAHAGLEPEKGASAILEIARQIERLYALNDPARGTTLNVGVMSGGTASNVVAAEAEAEIDIRFNTLAEAERIEKEILNSKPFDERVSLYVEGGVNRPPLERTQGVAALYEHARGMAAALGFELGEASVGGASDGNFIAALGVAVLDGLGINGDGAHAVHEHILFEDIPRRGALLAALIATL